ncbi:MAG: MotA/TolQ/ExbB proton channel family protein [Planctomycetaceae bacterium]
MAALCVEISPTWAQDFDVPVDSEMVESLMKEPAPAPPIGADKPSGIDLLSLITRGGAFMIPIGFMSLLVVTLVVERLLSLRRKRIIPKTLTSDLREISQPAERFSPSVAWAICRDHPSAAATAIEAMLMRTGQPLDEIERAATEAIQREADDYAAPIRWLTLAASATPLMGLLGTVWGMIVAFHESTTLTADRSRSEQLSEGIYTALVTTLAGLVVAIPAAIMAQYLENRLTKLSHRIERFAFELPPGLARFNGRMRLDADGVLRPIKSLATPATPPGAPSPPPTAAASSAGVANLATTAVRKR